MKEVKNILITLEKDEWKVMSIVKDIAGVTWEQVLKLGISRIIELFGGKEEFLRTIEEILKTNITKNKS